MNSFDSQQVKHMVITATLAFFVTVLLNSIISMCCDVEKAYIAAGYTRTTVAGYGDALWVKGVADSVSR